MKQRNNQKGLDVEQGLLQYHKRSLLRLTTGSQQYISHKELPTFVI